MAVIKNKTLDTFNYEEKFINFIMKHGKKSVAKRIYEDTLKDIKANGHMNPTVVVRTAIENASPTIMIKSKRIGGAVYQVPVEVRGEERVEKLCTRDFLKNFLQHTQIKEQL